MKHFKNTFTAAVIAISISGCNDVSDVFSSCPASIAPASAEVLEQVKSAQGAVAGAFWSKGQDCRYIDPPKDQTLATPALDCESTTHTVAVLKRNCPFYVSQNTAEDTAPYCLHKTPISSQAIRAAKARQGMYCKNEWPLWRNILSEVGF